MILFFPSGDENFDVYIFKFVKVQGSSQRMISETDAVTCTQNLAKCFTKHIMIINFHLHVFFSTPLTITYCSDQSSEGNFITIPYDEPFPRTFPVLSHSNNQY